MGTRENHTYHLRLNNKQEVELFKKARQKALKQNISLREVLLSYLREYVNEK